jgi:hypothetical protein
VLVGSTVEAVKRFAHHVQLRLAVPLEYTRVSLTQHLCHEMISHSTSAERGRERVPQFSHVQNTPQYPEFLRLLRRRYPVEELLPRPNVENLCWGASREVRTNGPMYPCSKVQIRRMHRIFDFYSRTLRLRASLHAFSLPAVQVVVQMHP